MKTDKTLPNHIAIIMDGNGRWAKERGLLRVEGHKAGAEAVEEIVTACAEMRIKALTLFAFSVENWKRPENEVNALMILLKCYLKKETKKLNKNNIKLNIIGRIGQLPKSVQSEIREAVEKTRNNTGLVLTLAINYSGRAEIVDGVKRILKLLIESKQAMNNIDVLVDEDSFSSQLYTAGLPELDLLIRTSGEMRISNFMLWQMAYAELYVTDVLWPDFDRRELLRAVDEFRKRDRRFGAV